MQHYFEAAVGQGIKSSSFDLGPETKWTLGGVTVGQDGIDAQTDPLAVAGNRFDPRPLRFYRGEAKATSLGQWAVYSSDDSIAGVYTALLGRELGSWRIRELTISLPDDELVAASPYCSKPGDLADHDIDLAQSWIEDAEKELGRRRERFAQADVRARSAEAEASQQPANSRRLESARQLRLQADREAEKVAQTEQQLAGAQELKSRAEAALAAHNQLTGPVRDAERLRQTEEVQVALKSASDEAASEGVGLSKSTARSRRSRSAPD
jgi:hypothetical protein